MQPAQVQVTLKPKTSLTGNLWGYIKKQYYNVAFQAKAAGALDLFAQVSMDDSGEWITNPRVYVLDSVYPQKAQNYE